MKASARAQRSKLIRHFSECLTQVIYSNPDFACIIVGCPQTSKLADLALQELGYESIVFTGKARTANGGKVDHVWVEVPEYDLLIETNAQQVMGYPMPVIVLPAEEHKREFYLSEEEIEPETFPATASTPRGNIFFRRLAHQVAECFRKVKK